MQTLFERQTHTLSGGSTLSGITHSQVTLRVLSGRVWITFEGQPDDHWVHTGRSLTLLPGRMVVVEADPSHTRIELTRPPQRGVFATLLSVFSRLRGPGFHPETSVL